MVLLPRRPAHAYRFIARLLGENLPVVDKALRIRCTLNAPDHTVVGVSSVALHLGTDTACDRVVELVHDAGAEDAPPAKYFELVATLTPTAAPATRLVGALARGHASDGTEYRISGILDTRRADVQLPEIVLRGA